MITTGRTLAARLSAWLCASAIACAQPTLGTYIELPQHITLKASAPDRNGNIYALGEGTGYYLAQWGGAPMAPASRAPLSSYTKDIVVLKISPAPRILYGAYFGGSGKDSPAAVAVDAAGDVYVTGTSLSTDFPTTPGALSPSVSTRHPGAFILKMRGDGSRLEYATGLNTVTQADPAAIAVDAAGAAYVTGHTAFRPVPDADASNPYGVAFPTNRSGWPVTAPDVSWGGAFVAKMNPDGSAIEWSLPLAGNAATYSRAITIGPDGGIWIAGHTMATDLPHTSKAVQKSFASRTLFSTTDAGRTWKATLPGRAYRIVGHPLRPAHLFAFGGVGAFFRSTDFGETWQEISLGPVQIQEVAFHPVDAGVVFANNVLTGSRLFKSTDGGASFTPVSDASLHCEYLLIHPSAPNRMMCAWGEQMRASADGGVTWVTPLKDPYELDVIGMTPGPPVTVWAKVARGTVERLGLYKSVDWGATWTRVNSTFLPSAERIVQSPLDPNGLFVTPGTRSRDGGVTWSSSVPGYALQIVFDPGNPLRLYAATSEGVSRSDNGGDTWAEPDTNLPNVNLTAIAAGGSEGSVAVSAAPAYDGFFLKLRPDGTAIEFASYLGGAGDESINAIGFAPDGRLWLAGQTASRDFAITDAGAPHGGSPDGFVACVDPASGSLCGSRALGGLKMDTFEALSINNSGQVAAVGKSFPTRFPVTAGAFAAGSQDPLAAVSSDWTLALYGTGAQLQFSTLFGRTWSHAVGVAYLPGGGLAVTGTTGVQFVQLTVTQPGTACSYDVSTRVIRANAAAQDIAVSVRTRNGCPWTAATNSPWMSVYPASPQSGPGLVRISVAPNAGATRVGSITVAGTPVAAKQEAPRSQR